MICSICKQKPEVRREGDDYGAGHWVISCCGGSVCHPLLEKAVDIWGQIHDKEIQHLSTDPT